MIPQSCEIDHSVTVVVGDTWSPRFVKPGALIRIWGPWTIGLPLIANAASISQLLSRTGFRHLAVYKVQI